MVALNPVVGVRVGAMPCRWQQLLQRARVDRYLIGGDLDRRDLWSRADRLLEEPACCPHVPTWGDEHIDDLPELVNGAVNVAPRPATLM